MKNWFERGVVVINDWETEQVDKAFAWLHKIEVGLPQEEQIPLCIFSYFAFHFLLKNSLSTYTCFEHHLHILISTCNLASSFLAIGEKHEDLYILKTEKAKSLANQHNT